MEWPPKPVRKHEAAARRVMWAHWSENLNHVKEVWRLVVHALVVMQDHSLASPSSYVAAMLVSRVGNDLFQVHELAAKGYGPQAASIAATIFEITPVIARIARGGDEAARKWLGHDELHRLPWDNVRKGIKYHVRQIHPAKSEPEVEIMVNGQMSDYEALCASKHGNPMLFLHGRSLKEGAVPDFPFDLGPDTNLATQQCLVHALDVSARSAQMAVAEAMRLVPEVDAKLAVNTRYNVLQKQSMRLNREAHERWGPPPAEAAD